MKQMSTEKINQIANIFHLLGDKNRLKIFLFLANEKKSVTQIVEYTVLTQSNVSHHLRLLKNGGLVSSCRCGKSIYYQITPNDIIANFLCYINS